MNGSELTKEWRREAGLTQEQAAQMVGVGQNTLCDWENGKKKPQIEQALALQEASGGKVAVASWAESADQRKRRMRRRRQHARTAA